MKTFNEKVGKRLKPILLDKYVDGQKVVVTGLDCDQYGMKVDANIIDGNEKQLTIVTTLYIPWNVYSNRRNLKYYVTGYLDGDNISS